MDCTSDDAVVKLISEAIQVDDFEVDLRFIQMFLSCLLSWDSSPYLRSISASIENLWEKYGSLLDTSIGESSKDSEILEETTRHSKTIIKKHCFGESLWEHDGIGSFGESSTEWEILEEIIRHSKTIIKKHCERLIWKSLKCKSFTSQEVHKFLHIILINIDYLLSCRAERGLLLAKNQIETLKEKLLIFMNLVQFAAVQCLNCKPIEDFNSHVLAWSNKAACLMFLYFVEYVVMDNEFENRANIMVTDLLHKANPCTPEFIEMCFAVITTTKFSRSDILLFVEFVSTFIDLLLKDLRFISKDDFEKLREGLIYIFVYLAGPPATSSDNSEFILIQDEIDAVLSKASHLICLFREAKVDSESAQDVLVELVNMIDKVIGKFDDQHLVQIPHFSSSSFPRTNGLGFVESLLLYLEYLEEDMNNNPKYVLSLKQQIFTIKEELAYLLPFLHDTSQILNEQKELKDLWEEIITVANQAELAIKQSFFVYHPLCLSYILLKIQDIKPKVMSFKGKDIYSTEVKGTQGYEVSSITSSSNVVNTSVPTLGPDGVVGFEEEIQELVDQLTRGTTKLGIVSIVGMGGIGKTTLAMKIFNEKSVTSHFYVRAFYSVSQVYRRKDMLLNILSDLHANDGELRSMTEQDLVERLSKRLKGPRYLIVLDDIWSIDVWNDVKLFFPDYQNGSRVVFTTRISEVPLLAQPNCSPHMLRFLTSGESWDLLKRKVFQKKPCPPDLIEVGRLIAENCKGLPLAVMLVGGLLAKTERSISWWQEVANDLPSLISGEGCRDVLELSYRHLSDALKSCLLYLGAFPEDTRFRAGDVTRLWAAEGFIQTSDRSCVLKVAKESLNYLGDRSMIIVGKRSFGGEIKNFRLHDLTRDFCINKAKKDLFLSLVDGHDVSFSMPFTYDGRRICTQGEWRCFLDAKPKGPTVHSLLCFHEEIRMDAYSLNSLFRNFKLLQVLHLPFVVMSDFPTELIMVIHLRYLRVAFSFGSNICVPLSFANLRNLETLHIGGWSDDVNLADTIWKMRRLRHMKVYESCVVALDDAIVQLPALETFGRVKFFERENGEELLRRLPNLRKLSCICYSSTRLDFLNQLKSLFIKVSEYTNQPTYPSAISFPSTIRKLTLECFQLSGTELSTMIGKLPSLQILKLKGCEFDGNRWDVDDDELPHLKFLELYNSDIEYWSATTDSFCSLEKLVLKSCSKLAGIPLCFGEVPTLRILKVTYCNEEVEKSAIQIQDDQLNLGNDTLEFVTFENDRKREEMEWNFNLPLDLASLLPFKNGDN